MDRKWEMHSVRVVPAASCAMKYIENGQCLHGSGTPEKERLLSDRQNTVPLCKM